MTETQSVLAEIQEKEVFSRQVILHFLRHGKAGYRGKDDHDGYLTDEGYEQARKAGQLLSEEIPNGAIVVFDSSPRPRCIQTAETARDEMIKKGEESNKHFYLHSERVKTFERIGLNDKATEEALDLTFAGKDPIKTWLENPNETVEGFEKGFLSLVNKIKGFSLKLNPDGPDVHIIIVSHTGPSEVFVGRLLKEKSIDPLANCEEFQIALPVSKKLAASITYKRKTNTLSLE